MEEDFVVCLGTVVFFALFFIFLLAWRFINYKETLMLAEKGLVKPQKPKRNETQNLLLSMGIIITMLGLALFLGLLPLGASPMGIEFPSGLGPWLLIGLIPLFFGLSLVLVYYINKKEKLETPSEEIQTDEVEQMEE